MPRLPIYSTVAVEGMINFTTRAAEMFKIHNKSYAVNVDHQYITSAKFWTFSDPTTHPLEVLTLIGMNYENKKMLIFSAT